MPVVLRINESDGFDDVENSYVALRMGTVVGSTFQCTQDRPYILS
jgi:hypothetical protein